MALMHCKQTQAEIREGFLWNEVQLNEEKDQSFAGTKIL
jgi:hypothetical protein